MLRILTGKNDDRLWEAFEAEAVPHLPDLYRFARWLVGAREDAEDLVQETLSEAMRSFHNYERGTNCRAWMTKIMYNLNGRRLRKLGRVKIVNDTDEMIAETIAFTPSIPATLTDSDIISAVQRVPEAYRQIVLLADVEEFAYKEIAEMVQIPIGTVMSRLHRGRKLLRMELAEYEQERGQVRGSIR
ncbi:MAG: sigma-70 family RNA polymerase sigma factor [bacterium]|nr:sigma-70 family RNA polymerase sigma factor [bacterium]